MPRCASGASGGILALADVLPDAVRAAVRADARAAATTRRARCSGSSLPLARLLGTGYGVAGLKAALKLIGCDVGVPRPPLAAAARRRPSPRCSDALAHFEEVAA